MNPHKCLIIDDRPTDWLMGDGNITFKSNMPTGDWTPYYHFNEHQKFVYDNDLCVIFSEQEDIDAMIDWLITSGQVQQSVIDRLTQLGYMDSNSIDGKPHFHTSPLFTGSLTGNGMNGNPLSAPWDVVRKYGFLPWLDRPFTADTPPQQVLRAPTDAELSKAKEMLQYFTFTYHWLARGSLITPQQLAKSRQMSPIQIGIAVSGTAYNQTVPAIPTSHDPAHSVLDLARSTNPNGELCADHYEPFLKTLVDGYGIRYALQGVVNVVPQAPLPVPPPPQITSQPTDQQVFQAQSWLSVALQWLMNSLKR